MRIRVLTVLAGVFATAALLYWQLGNAPAITGGVAIGLLGGVVLYRIAAHSRATASRNGGNR